MSFEKAINKKIASVTSISPNGCWLVAIIPISYFKNLNKSYIDSIATFWIIDLN
jgi:hypothetical protein